MKIKGYFIGCEKVGTLKYGFFIAKSGIVVCVLDTLEKDLEANSLYVLDIMGAHFGEAFNVYFLRTAEKV